MKVTFWKEEKYKDFFEKIKDILDEKTTLKPYFEFYYEGKKIRTDEKSALQIKDIKNEEFEYTLGKFIEDLINQRDVRYWKKDFQRCVNVIRWIDPVLSEFKQTPYGLGLQIEIQFGKIKELKKWGSTNDASEVKLSFKHLRSKNDSLYVFIHELIHIMQFFEGLELSEDEQIMLEQAEEYLHETTLPKLWQRLISKYVRKEAQISEISNFS